MAGGIQSGTILLSTSASLKCSELRSIRVNHYKGEKADIGSSRSAMNRCSKMECLFESVPGGSRCISERGLPPREIPFGSFIHPFYFLKKYHEKRKRAALRRGDFWWRGRGSSRFRVATSGSLWRSAPVAPRIPMAAPATPTRYFRISSQKKRRITTAQIMTRRMPPDARKQRTGRERTARSKLYRGH